MVEAQLHCVMEGVDMVVEGEVVVEQQRGHTRRAYNKTEMMVNNVLFHAVCRPMARLIERGVHVKNNIMWASGHTIYNLA